MTRIQIKRGTAASWTSANPILSPGEMGYETDTKKIKVGDGTTAWSSLVYSYFGVGSFTQAVGDGSATTITVTHGLNTRNVVVSVKDSATYAEVLCDVSATSVNAVTLTFATAPTSGQYIVTVIGDNVPIQSISNASPFLDTNFTLRNATDPTKQAQFSTSSITTGTTRTYTLPDANATFVDTTATQTLAGKTLTAPILTTPVIDGASTGTGVAVAATASTLALRDGNGNIVANNHIDGFAQITTSNGTTTLTAASGKILHFVGSSNQILVLPSAGISAGHQFVAINNSSGTISGRSSNNGVIHVLGPSVECLFTALVDTPTLPEHWEDSFYGANFAEGKVLNVNTSLTLAGTDGTTFTFPATNDTVVGIAATQALTNKDLTSATNTLPTSVVTLTGSQTLTNKTINNPTITNYTESVNAVGVVTSAATLSLATGTVLTATLTASTACTFTMPAAGAGKSFILILKQAATTGNGTATFTNVKWGVTGTPTITATAGKMDILSFISDGTNWYGSVSAGYTP